MNGEIIQRRVQLLPSSLANQIAAGEVIERPASVAKELLENSLDAGARRIDINVERGGTRLIRIRDDGCGIHRDDLALALDRHATSKIASLDELEHVRSLGFRGEALPSIASVSRLSLSSRIADEERGWRITAEGREPTDPPAPVAHPVGTTLEVRELFFNTPARRKFLRAEKTELRHIEDVVRRIALSRPDVALVLRHGERTLLSVAPARGEEELGARLARVCGAAFMKHALAVEFEGAGLALRGWLGLPSFTRSQSDLQHFFVNGRMVRDGLINHAIRQAYQDVLYPGRYPAYVLNLELDPAQVDVNVHPTKHEVRFRETRLVHDFLVSRLSHALSDSGEPSALAPPVLESRARPDATDASSARMRTPPRRVSSIRDQVASYAALGSVPGGLTGDTMDTPPLGFALARVHDVYLLAESADGLVLVDLRAARDRVAHRCFKAALAGDEIHSQPLLLPANVTLGPDGAGVLEREAPRLATLGIEVGRASPDSIWVRRLPSVLKYVDVNELLRDLAEIGISAPDEILLATVARHAGAGADAPPSLAEMNALLRDLEGLGTEADGSTPWVQLSNEDLAAFFRKT